MNEKYERITNEKEDIMNLRDQIGTDENILWEGTKDGKVSLFEAIFNPLMPFALIWFVFDMVVILGFSKTMSAEGIFLGGMIGFVALHMMPVWIYLIGIFTSRIKARNTEYLITDRGIYIKTGIFTTITEMKPFTDLSHVSVRQGVFDKMFGTGDVISVCNHTSTTSHNDSHKHGMNIENIADYETVFKLVKEYQEAIYSDTMYPNDMRPQENHGYKTTYVKKKYY